MAHDDLALPTPEQFSAFPYDPPYSIQTDLMKHVYASIEKRQVTIVESPTGTGKTLSLLCSSLTWLTDERERARKGQISQQASGSNEPSWVTTQAIQMRQRELEAQDREYEERLAKARKAEARLRALARARVNKRQRVVVHEVHDPDDNEDAFLPDDDVKDEGDNISPAVRALMAKVDKGPASHSWAEAEPTCTKVYYASRTHSQLAQVLPELRRLKFHIISSYSPDNSSEAALHQSSATPLSYHKKKRAIDADDVEQNVESDGRQWRTVSLGSRKQLCINEAVRSSSGNLDERCKELREGKGEKRCQYLPTGEDPRLLDLRDQILATPKDIEDLAAAGHNAQTCPYYASRRAIPQAELVTLPYNLLLQKTAREALGIDLTNQIVIIDEAHNLIPTLLSLSTVRITLDTLTTSLKQVAVYYQKFRTRLSITHAIHLKRLISYLGVMQKVVEDWKASKLKPTVHGTADGKVEVLTIPDFVQRLGRRVDGINLLEIETYLRQSKIAQKISGYADLASAQDTESLKQKSVTRTSPPLHAVEALMLGLAGAREDGRVILSIMNEDPKPQDIEIKYQLLNPSATFNEVVDAARSVVLAGGTMSPMSDVITQLFYSTPSKRISTFSCGHIIPSSHVQTLLLTKGPGGSLLEFKYAQQNDRQMLSELGQIILNFCNVIPGGLVVFFPSYSSLSFAQKTWDADHLLQKFGVKKKVFFEPHETNAVEPTLRSYAEAVLNSSADKSGKKPGATGALLLAVVGAKLSEGLNFSDDLARAVIVVGLPFANKNSPELQERMRYINEVEAKLGTKRQNGAKDAASELYENMCMNAVNQSIGRAIRHRSDWASLILIDRRYSSASIRGKLPSWIKSDLVVCEAFGKTMRHLADFNREKKLRAG